jgi:hypothetical protein
VRSAGRARRNWDGTRAAGAIQGNLNELLHLIVSFTQTAFSFERGFLSGLITLTASVRHATITSWSNASEAKNLKKVKNDAGNEPGNQISSALIVTVNYDLGAINRLEMINTYIC